MAKMNLVLTPAVVPTADPDLRAGSQLASTCACILAFLKDNALPWKLACLWSGP